MNDVTRQSIIISRYTFYGNACIRLDSPRSSLLQSFWTWFYTISFSLYMYVYGSDCARFRCVPVGRGFIVEFRSLLTIEIARFIEWSRLEDNSRLRRSEGNEWNTEYCCVSYCVFNAVLLQSRNDDNLFIINFIAKILNYYSKLLEIYSIP